MKNVGLFVLLVVALAGLYALPPISAEVCPEPDNGWTCIERVEADDVATGDFAEIIRSADEADGSEDGEGDGSEDGEDDAARGEFDISGGELIVGDDDWAHDLLTSTKWSFDLIEPSIDEDFYVVTYFSNEVSSSTPRVMRPPAARIQVLDIEREDVVLDVEYPEDVVHVEWTDDDELAVVSDDGALSVFARP